MGCPCLSLIQRTNELSVRRQCELLGMNRSSVYYRPKTPDEEARERKEKIMARIDWWSTQNPTWGARKMGEMGICPIYPKANLSKRNFKEAIVPYLLRNFEAHFPNQAWSIDITYVKLNHRHMYLTAIIDWYSRKIVGWKLSDTLCTKAVLDAVREAVETHGTPAIINSDQGSQFTSDEYKALLKERHIRQSMDGRRRWADNIMIERWFRSLKTEKLYVEEFETERELKACIEDYISQYNTVRPHMALGYETPAAVFAASFSVCA